MICPENKNNPMNQSEAHPFSKDPQSRTLPYPAKREDQLLAFWMLPLAYLLTDSFGMFGNPARFGVGAGIAIFLYAASAVFYAREKGIRIGRESLFWLFILTGTAGSYFFVYHASLALYIELFLRFLLLYFSASLFCVLLEGRTSALLLFDFLHLGLDIPLQNLRAQWRLIWRSRGESGKANGVRYVLLGIVLGLPLVLFLAGLLASADRTFGDLLDRMIRGILDHFGVYIGIFLLSLPLGLYLYALLYGMANRRYIARHSMESAQRCRERLGFLPQISIYTVLSLVVFLYLLFILIQAGYLFGALRGVLPEGFTYSEYARRGFFELVLICVLNLCMIFGAEIFGKGKGGKRISDGFFILLSGLTLFLIATAVAKMLLYIRVYGLTPLRVVPTVFLAYLAFVFILVIVGRFKRIALVPMMVYAFAFLFMCLAWSDMDGRIAEYNLAAYREGKIFDYGREILRDADVAAIPSIYRAWSESGDEDFKKELTEVIRSMDQIGYFLYGEEEGLGLPLKYNNLAKERAERLILRMELEKEAKGERIPDWERNRDW